MTAPLTGIQRVRLDALVEQLKERRMLTKAADLRQALDLLDTYAGIVERVREDWTPHVDRKGGAKGEWERIEDGPEDRPFCHVEPMTPDEWAVIHGGEA